MGWKEIISRRICPYIQCKPGNRHILHTMRRFNVSIFVCLTSLKGPSSLFTPFFFIRMRIFNEKLFNSCRRLYARLNMANKVKTGIFCLNCVCVGLRLCVWCSQTWIYGGAEASTLECRAPRETHNVLWCNLSFIMCGLNVYNCIVNNVMVYWIFVILLYRIVIFI